VGVPGRSECLQFILVQTELDMQNIARLDCSDLVGETFSLKWLIDNLDPKKIPILKKSIGVLQLKK
jgi:hypothetical protein